ncbi:CAP domain-containing protein [Candidatus Peregrinibacteria bacterium]|nr:CAP domain-containing protein [Candidatus Peregrinibacteria bacterium]
MTTNLLEAINIERAVQAHTALTLNAQLSLSAQRHAEDMIARDYFAHENPEGLRVGDRVRATGYGDLNAQKCRCSYRISIAENLAKGQKFVNHVIQSWLDSPKHREALLADVYDEVGIGIAGDVWVLNFGGIEINSGTSTQQ